MRTFIAVVLTSLVLGLSGAASSQSVGGTTGASAGPTSGAVVCTPAWGTPVIVICV